MDTTSNNCASGVWRCSVCHKVKNLSGPHLNGKSSVRSDCWPCAKKTTFVLDASGSRGGAAEVGGVSTPSQSGEIKRNSVEVNKSASVFVLPIVPLDTEEVNYLLPVTKAKAESSSFPALPAPSSSTSSVPVWRCSICHKVKNLSGPHLNGKSSVRSDCWPCAKKTTFILDTGAATAAPKSESSPGGDAKPPAASAFKSAFGAAATGGDAKPP
ncbi:hypothetical protein ABL78_6532, partial [Leptomonas seymouri]